MSVSKTTAIIGGIAAGITALGMIITGAVWALEAHFDQRYILVADSLQGALLEKQEQIFVEELKKNPTEDDLNYLKFLKKQEKQLQQQLGIVE